MPIQAIYCNPAICIARVGGSSVPMDAFTWVRSEDPHNAGETRIAPVWTLDVQADGSVDPRMPGRVVLRDAGQLRPVAPFIEIWCETGPDGQPQSWNREPLTTRLLATEGLNVANLVFTIEAMNFKAARRARNPSLRYGTFPELQIFGDQHTPETLSGVSPVLGAEETPMIPSGRFIDLGRVQIIRPRPQPAPGTTEWDSEINLETIRFRYTPPRGEFYGPTSLSGSGITVDGVFHPVIPAANAFLDPNAGWLGAPAINALIEPADTFDGAEQSDQRSLGIVDDTCELRVTVSLDRSVVGLPSLEARANIFSGPPDYAPDRRPFLSIADSLNDRIAIADAAQRNQDLDAQALDQWVENLFERAFETISLMNVDFWRSARASTLGAGESRPQPIPNDAYPDPARAMGARDTLRDGNIAIQAPSDAVPLPLSERARERHRTLSDIFTLTQFVRENPDRLQELMREPFSVADNESGNATTMQMPPFMRGSNAEPLTLAKWQYELLMQWRDQVTTAAMPVAFATRADAELASRAGARRSTVLGHLDQGQG